MNKDEIKKAFDICFSAQKSCNGCPLLVLEKQNGRGCKYNLFTSVFDLITEQEKEIERLKAENEELTKVVSSKVYDFIENIKEIAGVREVWERQNTIDVLNKLKERACGLAAIETYHICNLIDELLREI